MFTGLIETRGTISSVSRSRGAWSIGIKPDAPGFEVSAGGSVSVDGACLTLEAVRNGVFVFTAVRETLDRTTLGVARQGARVNLERPLPVGGRLDGHWVLGHVDGVGTVRRVERAGDDAVYSIEVPRQCAPFMAEKGSVALDGISLTIAKSAGGVIDIAVIPATLRSTTLGTKAAGDKVNIEADVVARYLCAMLDKAGYAQAEPLSSKMERLGF
ncbi:MAG: riboflavin synthase [Chitinispirillaceae bacterium]|nr:riboflavin synthase [Chitinispirillaceae bacterium]